MTTQPDPAYPVPTANTPTPEQRNYMYVIYGLYALGVISFAMPTIIGAIVANRLCGGLPADHHLDRRDYRRAAGGAGLLLVSLPRSGRRCAFN